MQTSSYGRNQELSPVPLIAGNVAHRGADTTGDRELPATRCLDHPDAFQTVRVAIFIEDGQRVRVAGAGLSLGTDRRVGLDWGRARDPVLGARLRLWRGALRREQTRVLPPTPIGAGFRLRAPSLHRPAAVLARGAAAHGRHRTCEGLRPLSAGGGGSPGSSPGPARVAREEPRRVVRQWLRLPRARGRWGGGRCRCERVARTRIRVAARWPTSPRRFLRWSIAASTSARSEALTRSLPVPGFGRVRGRRRI